MQNYEFDQFFTDVSSGKKGKSDVPYRPYYTLKGEANFWSQKWVELSGNFDDHIAKSIPGHREIQVAKSVAIRQMRKSFLDIGGSEGTLVNLIGQDIRAINIDLNEQMIKFARTNASKHANHICQPAIWEYDGQPAYMPDQKFDIVHESMVFQFIGKDRPVEFIKENYLNNGGLLLLEEKFFDDSDEWLENESEKDRYKARYFPAEELTRKAEEVLVGMHENMLSKDMLRVKLENQFRYVACYWNSFNFGGFAASDNLDVIATFCTKLHAMVWKPMTI